MNTPTGPRVYTRTDGTQTLTTGAVHTLILRVADKLRARTVAAPKPANTPSPVPTGDHAIYQRAMHTADNRH